MAQGNKLKRADEFRLYHFLTSLDQQDIDDNKYTPATLALAATKRLCADITENYVLSIMADAGIKFRFYQPPISSQSPYVRKFADMSERLEAVEKISNQAAAAVEVIRSDLRAVEASVQQLTHRLNEVSETFFTELDRLTDLLKTKGIE